MFITADFDYQRQYARHLNLAEFGEAAQLRLHSSHALIVGAGGLGSASASYLAAAGIGKITLVDFDRVELSNLHRQILHERGDIGRPKVHSATDRLRDLNPDVHIRVFDARIEHILAAPGALDDIDVVLDGSDRFETRLEVNMACVSEGVPLVSAAILGWEGQIGVFAGHLPDQPCYACLVPEVPPDAPNCRSNGILGPVAGIFGSWQAMEAIKIVTATGMPLLGRLARLDGRTGRMQESLLQKDASCPICGPQSVG